MGWHFRSPSQRKFFLLENPSNSDVLLSSQSTFVISICKPHAGLTNAWRNRSALPIARQPQSHAVFNRQSSQVLCSQRHSITQFGPWIAIVWESIYGNGWCGMWAPGRGRGELGAGCLGLQGEFLLNRLHLPALPAHLCTVYYVLASIRTLTDQEHLANLYAKALPKNGSTEYHDVKLGASWSYDSNSRLLVSYDTKPVTLQKIAYIQGNRLGGAMWWESSADKDGDQSLISTVSTGVGAVCSL
jgi:hypothetical protein